MDIRIYLDACNKEPRRSGVLCIGISDRLTSGVDFRRLQTFGAGLDIKGDRLALFESLKT